MNNVRKIACEILDQVFKQEAYSNLLLNKTIKENRVSSKDVGLLTELVYGTIQYKMTLDYYLSDYLEGKKVAPSVRNILRLSVYQMVYLDKIPQHAIINEAVEIAKKQHVKIGNFVNAVLRNVIRQGIKSLDLIEDEVERLSIETSHPKWLVTMWMKQYDYETAKKLCQINNSKAYQYARLNLYRESKESILERLKSEEVMYHLVDDVEEAIYITADNIAKTTVFKDGYLTIQDLSSMLVSKVLDPKPGENVLDTCSAPGGKATHLAQLMGNQGSVVACDIHPHKMDLIQYNVERLKTSIVDPVLCDATELSTVFSTGSFDRVLVDAPCSGFGVIRRKPEIKYNKSPEDLDEIITLQKAIIDEAVKMVKSGGKLVFSTCTINKKENEKMVEYLLRNNPAFELDPSAFSNIGLETDGFVQLIDQHDGADVFFISCFKRK